MPLEELLKALEKLKRSRVRNQVDTRLKELRETGKKECSEIFKELCFCILTANFNAERAIKIQSGIGDGFLNLKESELAQKLRSFGYRFPNTRAAYIRRARRCVDDLKETLGSFYDEKELREWLAKNVKGFGFKEASHFLRNIGYTDLAIIDFHILDILAEYDIIEKPKSLSKKKYLEIEEVLRNIAKKVNLNLAELDLYLWYMETGKILK